MSEMKSIHIQLPEAYHEVLKIECVLRKRTMREMVTYILVKELKKIRDERLKEEEKKKEPLKTDAP